MKLIVGLGNPGRQYENTPHNVGFHAIDTLGQRHGAVWKLGRRFEAMTAEIRLWDRNTTLMKPLTYMNLSGRSVAAWIAKNGGEPSEILVISDDVHLAMGRIRIRAGGSHGGQKGLLSIINALGTLDFPRLRIGIRPQAEDVDDLTAYVLRPVKPAEREIFEQSWQDAADAVEMIFKKDLASTMNHFNRKR
jgi:PTH1 family peptidyl-tRNA hydrolase